MRANFACVRFSHIHFAMHVAHWQLPRAAALFAVELLNVPRLMSQSTAHERLMHRILGPGSTSFGCLACAKAAVDVQGSDPPHVPSGACESMKNRVTN